MDKCKTCGTYSNEIEVCEKCNEDVCPTCGNYCSLCKSHVCEEHYSDHRMCEECKSDYISQPTKEEE